MNESIVMGKIFEKEVVMRKPLIDLMEPPALVIIALIMVELARYMITGKWSWY